MISVIGDSLIPRENNGGVPVNIQDQTSPMKDLFFARPLGASTTLKTMGIIDTYTIELDNATGFVDGNYVGVFCSTGESYFGHQVGAPTGTTLTMDTPLDFPYEVGCLVYNFTREMAVDGTAGAGGRTIFQVGPLGGTSGTQLDITGIHGVILDNLEPDDGKFGGIAALSKGCVLRLRNGYFQNYGNFKTNGEIGLYAGIPIQYNSKGAGGQYSAPFQWKFSGQENRGVTVRLQTDDILEFIIQDDLSDLISFQMIALGHYVTG